MYELTPRYDARKSFYSKAVVLVNSENATGDEYTKTLLSYQTPVAAIQADNKAVVFGLYSATTTRHIKEFLKQEGFKAESSKQIKADYIKA
jgi:hypothetical protein